MPHQEHTKTDLNYLAPWIKGQVVSVYCKGRDRPMTGLYVCAVYPHILVCRANGSTHLFPQGNICCIRYSPDAEPARNPDHPLHSAVRQKDGHPFAGGREAYRNTAWEVMRRIAQVGGVEQPLRDIR